ncbi:predicted protein [Naegleria gruberi]|uniref:Predicted protein n=1 Tax=Naegleria gruberi TaxID=5762 RepID=D2VR56_NAEGR|nr:uncharacterized protein NAEGRDRAFT_71468 [Naegleria gruberi]EFC40745.1 predicted protein [Naegleria gruberi]|eukprot:XP_002673489.1 predicted protein [Naegleria gruberi strain NEG-M]
MSQTQCARKSCASSSSSNEGVSNTKENQKAIELEIIKNNIARYHEEALDQLRRLIPKQKEEETKTTFNPSDIWQELKYPEFASLEKPSIITQADASSRVDSDVSRIAPFAETESMSRFIDNNIERGSRVIDCMGGYGHVAMACIHGGKRTDLAVFDHFENDEKSRSVRMKAVQKNMDQYHTKFSGKRKANIYEHGIHLKQEMRINNVLLLDARLITEKLEKIIEDFKNSNAREIVLKIPIHFTLANEFASRNPELRGIGMVMKCPSTRIHNETMLGMEEDFIQLLIIRKLVKKQNKNDRQQQYYNNDRSKKQKYY